MFGDDEFVYVYQVKGKTKIVKYQHDAPASESVNHHTRLFTRWRVVLVNAIRSENPMNDRPFNTGEPVAYFITWTTYGTWLPGDERGWHQWGKSGTLPPNQSFRKTAKSKMKETEFVMSRDDRDVVENTIGRHCDIRNWRLHTANARSNHVHVVVTAPGYDPKTVRDQFKAWCTRKLKPLHPSRSRFWTEGGSCRWINHEDDLEAAITYAGDVQDRKRREERDSQDKSLVEYKHDAPASED